MTDLEQAIAELKNHSICLCKEGRWFTDDRRGISPMMFLIREGKDLVGYSVADVVVGKAAAMLFIKSGIKAVYGKNMSRSAKEYLEKHGIVPEYDVLAEEIRNREDTDICPMEKTVREIDDFEEGYLSLGETWDRMRAKTN